MAENTSIEWCDATFNPWIGCTKVSIASAGGGGCDHCYAEVSTPVRIKRAAGVETWGPHGQRQRTSAHNWKQPLKWNAKRFMECSECGWRGEASTPLIGCGSCGSIELNDTRRRIFCASLADVFPYEIDNEVPVQWRRDLFDLIEATPHLDWLLLTKRIGNARGLFAEAYLDSARPWPKNVWLGATVVNQAEADRDIRKLLDVPARLHFLSMEPLLGPVSLRKFMGQGFGPAPMWVICGGESGPNARPMHPDWARSLRDQCEAVGVPFLFKQWGEWIPADQAHAASQANGREPIREFRMLEGHRMHLVGKKASGRLLDGRTHDGFPGGAA